MNVFNFVERAIWKGVITTEAFSILVNFGRKLTKLHEPSLASKFRIKNLGNIKRFRMKILSKWLSDSKVAILISKTGHLRIWGDFSLYLGISNGYLGISRYQ